MSAEDQQRKIFLGALVTQSILVVCYALIIVKSATTVRLNFVIAIAALMMTAAIMWVVQQYETLQYTRKFNVAYGSGDPCSKSEGDQYSICLTITLLSWVNITTYNVAGWLFAMRYWMLSYILLFTLEKEQPLKAMRWQPYVLWVGLGITVLASCYLAWSFYFGLPS